MDIFNITFTKKNGEVFDFSFKDNFDNLSYIVVVSINDEIEYSNFLDVVIYDKEKLYSVLDQLEGLTDRKMLEITRNVVKDFPLITHLIFNVNSNFNKVYSVDLKKKELNLISG